MKELLEYREKLITRIGEATKEFCLACESFESSFEKVDDWNVHEIAAHTRDVEKFVYGERVRKTLYEEKPQFKSFDADAWLANTYNKDEPLNRILIDLDASIRDLCSILKNLNREDWSRLSSHQSAGNELTLQVWVERGLAHIEEHLKSLKKK